MAKKISYNAGKNTRNLKEYVMADYDEDCKGKKPKGCMCYECCKNKTKVIK